MTKSESPSLCVRAPWPDEMPRLKQFLTGHMREAGPLYLRVLLADSPERIVGAAALRIITTREKAPKAEIAINIRPRFIEGEGGSILIAESVQKLKQLKCSSVTTGLPSNSPLISLLCQYGFKEIKTEELWQLELTRMQARLKRVERKLQNSNKWIVRTPTESDLPQLMTLCKAYKFLEAQRVQFDGPKDPPGTHLTSQYSTVIEARNTIIAALLAKGGTGLNTHVDVRLIHPDYIRFSKYLNPLLLSHSVQEAINDGYQTTTLTVNLKRDRETRNLAKRTHGDCLRSKVLLQKDLAEPK